MTLLVVWSLESLGPIAPPISITPFPVGDVVNVGLVIWNGNSGPEKIIIIFIFQPALGQKIWKSWGRIKLVKNEMKRFHGILFRLNL